MNEERILVDQTVIVRSGRIRSVGSSSSARVPSDAQVIDGTGLYMIPGLVDSHVHLYNEHQLELFVANGVTTVFNLNGTPAHLIWRGEIEKGTRLGPRIYTVAPKFDRADAPDTAVALVDRYAAQGYDGVKIYDQVSRAEYPALIAAAKRHHMLAVGHIAREPGFEETVQAGQTIAHAEEYLYTFFKEHGAGESPDTSLIPRAVSLTRAGGAPVITTLVTYEHILQLATNPQAFDLRPEMRYWAPWELEDIKSTAENPYLGASDDDIATLRRNYPFLKLLVSALHQGGVPILAGTDAGWVQAVPGFSLHEELQDLVDGGFTPYEALRSATTVPARYLRGEREFGTIETGKVADLVLLRANPLEAIANTKAIAGVVVRGRWLPRIALDSLLEQLPREYLSDERTVEDTLARDPKGALAFLADHDPFFELGTAVAREIAVRDSIGRFEQLVRASRESDPASAFAGPDFLNDVAGYLMERQRSADAIALFQFNVALHPASAIAYDRLGRAYYKLGQYPLSLQFYRKALEVDSSYWNASFAKRRIGQLLDLISGTKH